MKWKDPTFFNIIFHKVQRQIFCGFRRKIILYLDLVDWFVHVVEEGENLVAQIFFLVVTIKIENPNASLRKLRDHKLVHRHINSDFILAFFNYDFLLALS